LRRAADSRSSFWSSARAISLSCTGGLLTATSVRANALFDMARLHGAQIRPSRGSRAPRCIAGMHSPGANGPRWGPLPSPQRTAAGGGGAPASAGGKR
jgi:hypothetical protein